MACPYVAGVTPAFAGVHVSPKQVDSRFRPAAQSLRATGRGNDVILDGLMAGVRREARRTQHDMAGAFFHGFVREGGTCS